MGHKRPSSLKLLDFPAPDWTLVRDSIPTGYKLMRLQRRIAKRGFRLGSIEQTSSELQRGKEDQQKRSYIRSVMAGHHCSSARAFAVNPSRLPATLRAPGVDRESAAKQRACRAINAELRSHEPS